MKCGIYKFTNKINGKIYIGQSNNLERRKTEHSNGSTKQEIDRAIAEEGKENFTFTVIEYCKESELDALEQYWIAYYDSYYNGYNHTKGGQNSFCGHPILTKEDVIHIREAYAAHQRRKNVYLLYGDGFIYTSSLVAKQDRFFKVHVNHSTWIHYLYYCDRINEQRRVRT